MSVTKRSIRSRKLQLKRKYENQTRQNIVKCAARLFADGGFHGTGVREIVDKAGVALNSVNYYFGSKENLYLESIKFVLKEKIQFNNVFTDEMKVPTKKQELSNYTKKKLETVFDIFFGTNRRYWYADMITRAFQDEVEEALDIAIMFLNRTFKGFAMIYEKAKGEMNDRDYYLWTSRLWFNIFGCTLWRNILDKESMLKGFTIEDRNSFFKATREYAIEKAIAELGLPKAK